MRAKNALLAALILASGATLAMADILPGPRPRRPTELPVPAKITLTGAAANEIARLTPRGWSQLVAECQKEPASGDFTCTLTPLR
jgi:hypothetical protein